MVDMSSSFASFAVLVASLLVADCRPMIDPAHAANITIYHVNRAQDGVPPINMDTGDAAGDLYFDLRSVDIPMECAHPSKKDAKDCVNPEVVAEDLVITELKIEVDTRWGPYAQCNFCVNNTDGHGHTCKSGEYVCFCDELDPVSRLLA
jgi:hypothetical protein